MTSLGTRLLTWLTGKYVGKDVFGNRYYYRKTKNPFGQPIERRWVIYHTKNAYPEPSKVPPLWNGWLHGGPLPTKEQLETQYAWEKDFVPNLTGTPWAYRPEGHQLKSGQRPKTTGDYEAWVPPAK